ncbi:MAG: hypothetical protein WD577_11950 [Bacteroidales bacterium]
MSKPIADIKILIIEDDQEKREELVEILRDAGLSLVNVSVTGFAETGIEKLEDEQPDVVLLDLKIPYNEESMSLNIDNSNKVIHAVERLNVTRNQEADSTGILIISASVDDRGIRNQYKHTKEVIDFFDKDEIALNKEGFKQELLKKIQRTVEREIKHECAVEYPEIRKIKLSKLKPLHLDLHNRIVNDLLGDFEKLNNRNVNTSRVSENIIGLAGRIVEDIINLIEDDQYSLSENDQSDNFTSVRNRLINLSGRKYLRHENRQAIYKTNGERIISRKAAEYGKQAYILRSEALHSKDGDRFNNKIFKDTEYTIEDAAISIGLIIPLISEFITYLKNK